MYRHKMGGYIVFECWGFKKVNGWIVSDWLLVGKMSLKTAFTYPNSSYNFYPCHINVELSAWFIDMFALKRPNIPRYPIS